MKVKVLDACAAIAYFLNEDGAETVESFLIDPETVCYIHAVNMLEIYYDALRRGTVAQAKQMIEDLLKEGVIVRRDLDDDFLFAIGALKKMGGVSLADCFCIALAQRTGGDAVTSDHHEFDALVPLGLCHFLFIR